MSDKSIWVNYLDKRITEDKYTLHREKCAYQLEGLVSQMTQDLLKHNPDYTTDIARKGAINLLMEHKTVYSLNRKIIHSIEKNYLDRLFFIRYTLFFN